MPQLLIELFSEEIPARMQANAARDLERLAREKLAAEGLLPEALKTFAGARRLTLVAEGLPEAQKDRHEELKGPKVGAPPQALEGFLRKTGLTQDQLTERAGVYFAHVHKAGRPTPAIVAEMVEQIVRTFPWPKSMVSGTSKLRWVRPLRRITCVFGGQVVPFEIDGIPSGNTVEGHRFMGDRQPFEVKDFDTYADGLEKRCVVLDVEARKDRIVDAAKTLAFARNLELVEDQGLLDEVAGLVEWPVPVLGDMDPAFLDLPPEVIRTSMRVHQRYFAVRDPKTGKLAPHFLTVANIQAKDGGEIIAKGNAKVLSARLSDARFFWNEDRKTRLEERLEKLKGVTFHAKLGSMYERVERIVALAGELAPLVGADRDRAVQAARLAKADLVSGLVGEFPELQGVMGGYYAEAEGLDPAVVEAIRSHYRPQGPSDAVPTDKVAATVALADKLDTLTSFFSIGEKPTGSRDPFALRRAALGVIRIVLETRTRLPLKRFVSGEVLDFFADRLAVLLREQGRRHDLVAAVFALGDDDLVRIVAKVEALDAFLKTEDGANLLAGYKRAVNILRAEEKKGPLPAGEPTQMGGAPVEEQALVAAVGALDGVLDELIDSEDFAQAMAELAKLRGPVDAFFDKVLVNSDNPAERDNRLRLLARVRDAMGRVADFSQVTG
ncbi:glycine--tRNA ligase subunit beta [Phenylobacterium sp. J426]|uniref:glycine--tRNA ligase subunit beta n=1 Tax=Phenylobacterium sp. J426 TaxID=2898439 RepID=UPI002150D720|nr:glycine--tRNA ligase subunit beta [Phenylobacterium sp. J426]MCR5875964.1 glycine--tRNA ligase subunit beta [Phenylobacterium sp. J426]